MSNCARTRQLEERLAKAESLLLEAAWAFRHWTAGGDQQSEAYRIALHLQTFELEWHERRRRAAPLAHCTLAHSVAATSSR